MWKHETALPKGLLEQQVLPEADELQPDGKQAVASEIEKRGLGRLVKQSPTVWQSFHHNIFECWLLYSAAETNNTIGESETWLHVHKWSQEGELEQPC